MDEAKLHDSEFVSALVFDYMSTYLLRGVTAAPYALAQPWPADKTFVHTMQG